MISSNGWLLVNTEWAEYGPHITYFLQYSSITDGHRRAKQVGHKAYRSQKPISTILLHVLVVTSLEPASYNDVTISVMLVTAVVLSSCPLAARFKHGMQCITICMSVLNRKLANHLCAKLLLGNLYLYLYHKSSMINGVFMSPNSVMFAWFGQYHAWRWFDPHFH